MGQRTFRYSGGLKRILFSHPLTFAGSSLGMVIQNSCFPMQALVIADFFVLVLLSFLPSNICMARDSKLKPNILLLKNYNLLWAVSGEMLVLWIPTVMNFFIYQFLKEVYLHRNNRNNNEYIWKYRYMNV